MENEEWFQITAFPNYWISSLKRIKRKWYTKKEVRTYAEKIYAKKRFLIIFFDGKYLNINVGKTVDRHFTEKEKSEEAEKWKALKDIGNDYEISNHGRVKRLERKTEAVHQFPDKVLTSRKDGKVTFRKNDKQHLRVVERLYKEYVLNEDMTPKRKKHRRKLKLRF
ncbi:NUMOD4 domain-containing protein [Costertonia aggregata]|uniref:Uncharacterized protein n=1 Tax=Costertonia aggregata TaxID=343403 RepID=A0A7H9ARH9_9FLAO|nr:NUMOD4 domain-containing protein [Costertonia aggregata]QLG46040.1 hypothetical protein HYG79_12025 [Costertonia aggregata]